MIGRLSRKRRASIGLCILAVTFALAEPQAQAASPTQSQAATLQGHVCDASGKPVADAVVSLQRTGDQTASGTSATAGEIQTARTDSKGAYRFSSIREGAYTLRAETKAGERTAVTSVELTSGKTGEVDLVLAPMSASAPQTSLPSQLPAKAASSAKAPEFFDEPQFTVAGITQASNSGGHGSDNMLRTSEALVRATGSLGNESLPRESAVVAESTGHETLERERKDLQALIRHDETVRDEQAHQRQAERYHRLAQLDERLEDPLDAVREYQHAAELDPSEPHLFDWASELLTHRALEPATEVFAKGCRIYPQSARMLIGLGVSWYARGSYDRASQYLAGASDLAPADPTPYLFMGKMQSAETIPSEESLKRLARFQQLAPENALANYYYAVGLWKRQQSAGALDDASAAQVEALLQNAVQRDPKMGEAYLQLGILYAQGGDSERAMASYQKAVEASPGLEEAHYRLAQAYRRAGKAAEAQKEFQLHDELAKKSKEEAERRRREIQEFVISLRD